MVPEFDHNKDIDKDFIVKKKGISIKLYGFTPETKDMNKCGSTAIENLLPFPV